MQRADRSVHFYRHAVSSRFDKAIVLSVMSTLVPTLIRSANQVGDIPRTKITYLLQRSAAAILHMRELVGERPSPDPHDAAYQTREWAKISDTVSDADLRHAMLNAAEAIRKLRIRYSSLSEDDA